MKNSLSHLFKPLQVGRLSLPNRIVMSPMTRYRANEDGVPDEYNALYYQQRAAAAFVVSESNYFDPTGRLAPLATGLYNAEQIAAWRKVTQDVHAAGGRMFAQLVHCGRVSHPSLQPGGALPFAPSPIRQNDLVRLKTGKVEPPTPRALETMEIHKVIEGFAGAVCKAIEAGFDGVELHAGSGFLHHQFLSSNSNRRSDQYGGAAENRCRFVLETIEAMIAVDGPEYVGIKIAPNFHYHDMHDADPTETYSHLCQSLCGLGLAYVHVQVPPQFLQADSRDYNDIGLVRTNYDGVVMAAGDFDRYSAEDAISSNRCDLVAFGRRYIANPDLVERFHMNREENSWDEKTFYSSGPEGFINYPFIGDATGERPQVLTN
jgi:N-ethylmaleimide reductase